MITFIAPAFNEDIKTIPFVGSMLAQKDPRWKAIIYHNGVNPEMRSWVSSLNDPRLTYRESDTNTGYWGCFNRIDALSKVDTEYVVQTSIQDYFTNNAVGDILQSEDFPDIIYWNSIHHYFEMNELVSELEPARVDWGNFAIRTSIAKQVGINHPTEFMADWLFVKDCLDSGLIHQRGKINKILTVHN